MNFLFKIAFSSLLIFWSYFSVGQIDSTSTLSPKIEEQTQPFIDPIYVTGTIDSAYADTAAGLAWIVVNGVATSYAFNPPDYPIIIRDDSGMQYTINPNGTVTVTSYLQYSNDHLDVGALAAVVFQQNNNETFGFDAKEHSAWVEQYELIRLTDSTNYFVANKSIGVDTFDVVDFTFNDSLWDATDFTYQLNGASITPTKVVSGNKITLTLPAIANSGKGKLYVMAGQLKVGKLNLQVYTKKTKKVVIVPLTNSPPNISAIATELKATLGEANLSVEVILKPQWNDVVFTASKAISLPTEVGLMNKYSDDMRDLREAYFEANVANLVEGAYYIFVVSSFSDNTVDGYMVRGKALGFVAASASASTYAHELGHGIGGLNHTWKENGPAEGATSNLMDYNGGNELTLDQWKELRDKDVIPSFWDEAEDEMATSGLVAYYFWDETQTQYSTVTTSTHWPIKDNKVISAFRKNSIVLRSAIDLKESISEVSDWKNLIQKTLEGNFGQTYSGVSNKGKANELRSVIYYKDKQGYWTSVERDPVLYFEVSPLGNNQYEKTFMFASKRITLSSVNVDIVASTHIIVKKFLNANGSFNHYEIFDFSGKDISQSILNGTKRNGERHLVFSNGYRGPDQNWDVTDGLITTTDRFSYWPKILEDSFAKRLKSDTVFFIDGSDRITTSNHITMGKFADSYLEIDEEYCEQDPLCNALSLLQTGGLDELFEPEDPYDLLNNIPNLSGFIERKNKGKLASQVYLAAIGNQPIKTGQKDTIDVVAHSMGYAYALGFIEALGSKVVWGRMYILAPENACSGGADWTKFEEVWQYGSNNNPNDPDRDPFWLQDGIAPQCAVLGIDPAIPNIRGRAYIPKNITIPNGILGQFDGRHLVNNYGWIFTSITDSQQDGYVKHR